MPAGTIDYQKFLDGVYPPLTTTETIAAGYQDFIQALQFPSDLTADGLPMRTQVAQQVREEEAGFKDKLMAFLANNNPLTGFGPKDSPFHFAGMIPPELVKLVDPETLKGTLLEKTGQVVGPPLDGLFMTLNEFARPQKAGFAGVQALQQGQSMTEALRVAGDELVTGLGSGQFKRDVFCGDLLFPDTPRAERSGLEQAGGFACDIVIDPFNFRALSRLPGMALRGLYSASVTGISHTLNASPEIVQRSAQAAVDMWKKSFIVEVADSVSGHAVNIRRRTLDAFGQAHQGDILRANREVQREVKRISKEFGIDQDVVADTVRQHVENVKLRDPTKGIHEAAENTMARIYNEYGLAGYNRYMDTAGLRDMVDFSATRRGILAAKFDPKFLAKYGEDATDRVGDLVFELKERGLERMHRSITERVMLDPDTPRAMFFDSIEKDYLTIIATDDLKTWMATLVRRPGAAAGGFDFNPMNVSDLHSQVQPMGIDAANKLVSTPRFKGSSESRFFVKDPVTGNKLYAPVMNRGFETDPFYIDAVREYYFRMSLEQSEVFEDLVRGYGRTLDDTMMIDRVNPKTGRPERVEIDTFKTPAQVVNPSATLIDGKLVAAPGTAVSAAVRGARKLSNAAATALEEEGLALVKGVKGFENVVMPTEAADLINKIVSIGDEPGTVADIMGVISKLQNDVWKPWTLFIYPEYHSRNIVSNVTLMWAAGMPIPEIPLYVARGVKLLMSGAPKASRRRFASLLDERGMSMGRHGTELLSEQPKFTKLIETEGVVREGKTIFSNSIAIRELMDGVDMGDLADVAGDIPYLQLVSDLGIARSGEFGTSEISRSLQGGLKFNQKGRISKLVGLIPYASTPDNSTALRIGMGIGGAIEDSMRVGLWLYLVEKGGPAGKGMNVLDAARLALKSMVDFGDLTATEQKLFKGVLMPFYAWSRKSIPLMFEHLIDEPQKWSRLNKIKREMEAQMFAEGETLDERLVPEYVTRGASIPSRRAPDGSYQFIVFDTWFAQAQLAQLDSVDEISRFFLAQSLSPIIRTAGELLFQKSLFMDADFGKGKVTFAGMRIDPNVASLLRNLRILGQIDRVTRVNNPGLMNNMIRFATGFNKLKIAEDQAGRGFAARTAKMEKDIASALVGVIIAEGKGVIDSETALQESEALILELAEFMKTGRE